MKSATLLACLALSSVVSIHAATITSTFNTYSRVSVSVDATSRDIALNDPASVISSDTSLIDSVATTGFDFDGVSYGSIAKGNWFVSGDGGAYVDNIRNGNGILLFANANSGSTGDATTFSTFSFLFEAKEAVTGLNVDFDYGTASSSGVWNNNTSDGNGDFNVRIEGLSGGASGDFNFYGSNQVGGAGASVSVSAVDQTNATLSAGIYRLDILISNQASDERSAIDNVVFEAVAVPEPSSVLLVGLALAGGVIFRRRR